MFRSEYEQQQIAELKRYWILSLYYYAEWAKSEGDAYSTLETMYAKTVQAYYDMLDALAAWKLVEKGVVVFTDLNEVAEVMNKFKDEYHEEVTKAIINTKEEGA